MEKQYQRKKTENKTNYQRPPLLGTGYNFARSSRKKIHIGAIGLTKDFDIVREPQRPRPLSESEGMSVTTTQIKKHIKKKYR